MANVTPQLIFGEFYESTGSAINLSVSDLPGVSAAEANPTSGDARAVLYGILDRAESSLNALDPAARPAKMSLTRGAIQNVSAGNGKIVVRESFTVTFEKQYMGADGELAAEE